jgi:hypothetical protein
VKLTPVGITVEAFTFANLQLQNYKLRCSFFRGIPYRTKVSNELSVELKMILICSNFFMTFFSFLEELIYLHLDLA